MKEQEAEISTLRQAAQLHQAALVQERDRSQREMATLQNQMQAKVRNLHKTQLWENYERGTYKRLSKVS